MIYTTKNIDINGGGSNPNDGFEIKLPIDWSLEEEAGEVMIYAQPGILDLYHEGELALSYDMTPEELSVNLGEETFYPGLQITLDNIYIEFGDLGEDDEAEITFVTVNFK